jgi:CBS domain containing-hemolysin-like protein
LEILASHYNSITVLLILTVLSGFMSGCETAYFNLSYADKKRLEASPRGRAVLRLTQRPSALLNTLLLANMAINVLYFSIAGKTAAALSVKYGAFGLTAASVLFLVWLILFGEILPKSIAFSHSAKFCSLSAAPLLLIRKILTPIILLTNAVFVKPAVRIMLPLIPANKKVKIEHLRSLVRNSSREGIIDAGEAELISKVVGMGTVKTREIMIPRVDMALCEAGQTPEEALSIMAEAKVNRLPVYRGVIDNVIGMVSQRDILINKPESLTNVLRAVAFMPEQKTVESLLEYFLRSKTDLAMIVDEYGGLSGMVTVKGVLRSITAAEKDGRNHITQLSENVYRVNACASLAVWLDLLELPHIASDYSTIGGFVLASLRKMPHTGDSFCYENLRFTVERVSGNRILTVLVELS